MAIASVNRAIIEAKISQFHPETIELTSIIAQLVTSRPFANMNPIFKAVGWVASVTFDDSEHM